MTGSGNIIFAYAFLRACAANGSPNPVSALKPLIHRSFHACRSSAIGGSVALSRVIDDIKSKYGIELPISVAEYCARDLLKDGSLTFDKINNRYFIGGGGNFPFESIEESAKEKYKYAVGCLQRILLDEGRRESPSDFLEEWLDKSSISFLGDGARAYNATAKDYEVNRLMRLAISRWGDDFLVALSDLAIGDAIFRAIKALSQLDLDSGVEADRKIETVAIFDTPLIMGVLGYSSEYRNKASQQILQMCRSVGMKVAAFVISVDEVERILAGAANNIARGNPATGEIKGFIFENGVDSVGLLDERAMVNQRVREVFEVIDPPRLTRELSISELDLEEQITSNVRQRYPEARKHDVEALAAVYRIRKGEPKVFFEKSDAIFVTGNKSLADSSTIFFQEMFREDGKRNQVQIAMHQTVFASRLWTKLPTISSDIARPLVIAQVNASLLPNPRLREAFLEELSRLSEKGLITKEKDALVKLTHFTDEVLGERFSYDKISISSAETNSIIVATLDKVKAWKSKQRDEIEAGVRKRIESYENDLVTFEARVHEAESDADTKLREASELAVKIDQALGKLTDAREKVEKITGRVYWISLFGLFIFMCYLATGAVAEDGKVSWNDAKYVIFLVIAALFALADRIFKFRHFIQGKVSRALFPD